MIVLGLHCGVTLNQHEPSAAIAVDGRIVAACEEERYLRIKSAYGYLPYYAIKACLKIANIPFQAVELVVTPGVTYDDFEERVRDHLRHSFGSCPRIERVHHHLAHLASAFYGSGLEESLCLSLDGTGDGACGMLAHATRSGGIRVLEELPAENSLGFFYTLMTYYLGFADGDEYKVMGLAPYGRPSVDLSPIIHPSRGGWTLNRDFVRSSPPPRSPFEPLYSAKLTEFLGAPNRLPSAPITDFHRDIASSTQAMTEDCVLSLARHLRELAPEGRHLCYAGGLALNCSVNRRLLYSELFDDIYVSPVSSDRGLALGCAYLGALMAGDSPWPFWNAYLGSAYSNQLIRQELSTNGCRFEDVDDPAAAAAEAIADGRIVGWFQGRSEAGARALGNRSIVASCSSVEMRERVNAGIKYREEFRPFAPSMLQESADEWFITKGRRDFPYMTFTLDAAPGRAQQIPAVVHVDGTSRIQSVRSSDNELYYDLIRQYANRTGVPVILNTSFNLKGQPIVETPRDALMTFFGCGLDVLVLGNCVVRKNGSGQPD